jgi:hypothetical protein
MGYVPSLAPTTEELIDRAPHGSAHTNPAGGVVVHRYVPTAYQRDDEQKGNEDFFAFGHEIEDSVGDTLRCVSLYRGPEDRLTGGPIGGQFWDQCVENGLFYAGSHEDNTMIEHDESVGAVRRREVNL